MKSYLTQNIESNQLLCDCVIDCTKQDLQSLIDSKFGDASCIIIHYSYKFPGEGVTPEVIKNAFNEKGIPVVLFSGDYSNNSLKPSKGICNADVRSSSLYENLPLFIRKYTNEGIISIPLLAFGPKYLLNTLLGLQANIQEILISLNDDDVIGENDADEILDKVAMIKEPELQTVRSQLVDLLKDSDLVYSKLKEKVQSIIEGCQQ